MANVSKLPLKKFLSAWGTTKEGQDQAVWQDFRILTLIGELTYIKNLDFFPLRSELLKWPDAHHNIDPSLIKTSVHWLNKLCLGTQNRNKNTRILTFHILKAAAMIVAINDSSSNDGEEVICTTFVKKWQ